MEYFLINLMEERIYVILDCPEIGVHLCQKNLNQSKIKGIPIRLPSLNEQNQVVGELRLIRRHTDNLAVIYTKKLNDLDELKKSILQKAFSGELTKKKEGAAA